MNTKLNLKLNLPSGLSAISIDELARQFDLGNALAQFRWNRKKAIADLAVGGGLTVVLILCIAGCIWLKGLLVPFIFYSILTSCAIAQCYSFWRCYRGLNRYMKQQVLVLFDQGLIDARTKPQTILHYKDLHHLRLEVFNTYSCPQFRDEHFVRMHLTYSLECFNRPTILLCDDLDQIEVIGKVLRDSWLEHQLPTAMANYLNGKVLHFEALSLSREGLLYRGEAVAIANLDQIHLQDGRLQISSSIDNWSSNFKVSEFPNLDLFLTLLNWIKSR